MSLKKCECVILRGDKFSETKKVITFFSLEDGKKKGVASGFGKMKSRYGSSLDVITHSSIVFFESPRSDLHRISQADVIQPFGKIKNNFDKLQAAIYLAELVRECIPENSPSPDIFKLLLFFLKVFDCDSTPPSKELIRIFEVRFIEMLGISPPLDLCIQCGNIPKENISFFDPKKVGIVCRKCKRGRELPQISKGGTAFIEAAKRIPLNKIKSLFLGDAQEREVRNILHLIVVNFINKELHSFRFLYSLEQCS